MCIRHGESTHLSKMACPHFRLVPSFFKSILHNNTPNLLFICIISYLSECMGQCARWFMNFQTKILEPCMQSQLVKKAWKLLNGWRHTTSAQYRHSHCLSDLFRYTDAWSRPSNRRYELLQPQVCLINKALKRWVKESPKEE